MLKEETACKSSASTEQMKSKDFDFIPTAATKLTCIERQLAAARDVDAAEHTKTFRACKCGDFWTSTSDFDCRK